MRTIKLDNGKYEFDIEDGQMMAARTNGVDWPATFEDWRHSKCIMAMLERIAVLEEIRDIYSATISDIAKT
jgi:hypothetical protein